MNDKSTAASDRPLRSIAVAAIAVVIAIGGTALTVKTSRQDRQMSMAQAARAFEVLDILRLAAAEIAMERGGLYAALHATSPAATGLHSETLARRGRIDDLLLRAGETLRASDGGQFGLTRIVKAIGNLEDVRSRVDQALRVNARERDPDLPDAWFRATTDVVLSLQQVLVATQGRIAHADPYSHLALDLQRRVWEVTDYAGKERAVIAAAATLRQPLDRRALHRLNWYRHRLVQEWNAIEGLAVATGGEGVRNEIRNARRAFFKDYERTRESMVLRNGDRTYPLGPSDWFSKSTEAIGSLYAVGSVAGSHAAAHLGG